MQVTLALNWGVNAFTGWGLVATNILGHLVDDPDITPIAAQYVESSNFMSIDPMKYARLAKMMHDSKEFDGVDCIWMDPIGNDLKGHKDYAKELIGRVIIEKANLGQALDGLSRYDRLLTGSTWNQEMLESATGRTVKVIHEGIDPSLFCLGAKSGQFPYFYVYSCGKVEYRKAQDVVLMAFKRFSQRHEDARLVTMWNSPFADIANGFKATAEAPLWLNDSGHLDVKRWARDNGIDETKVMDIGCCPNYVLPNVLREMDVMLAPSRVESCTSLPVKEAMACGVPVIAGMHSGMRDLLSLHNSIPLLDQKPIKASSEYFFPSADIDWYESDPEEIDASLEWVYQNREKARALGKQASEWIHANRTWQKHVAELKQWLLS